MNNQAQTQRPMGIVGDQSKNLDDFEARWHTEKPSIFHIFHKHDKEKSPYTGCVPVDEKDASKGMHCRECKKEVPKALLFTVITRRF